MTIREMLSCLRTDLHRYRSGGGFGTFLKVYCVYPGFRLTVWFRIAHLAKARRGWAFLSPLTTLLLLRQQRRTGIEINPACDIGPGLYMPHFGGIVVNPSVAIGRNCYLSHGVTLGKSHAGDRAGVPLVGDDVFIGPGAKLIGRLKVGDNAAIGANSVVLSDIPPNCFAAGMPARVVKDVGADVLLGRLPNASAPSRGSLHTGERGAI